MGHLAWEVIPSLTAAHTQWVVCARDTQARHLCLSVGNVWRPFNSGALSLWGHLGPQVQSYWVQLFSVQSCFICLHIWREYLPGSLLYITSQNLRVCFLGNQTDRKRSQRVRLWAQEGKRVSISCVNQPITAQNNCGSISLGSLGRQCRTLLRGTRKLVFSTNFHSSLIEGCVQSCKQPYAQHLLPACKLYKRSPMVEKGISFLQ